jgi:ubiquinone/menaquinone biosynthesis C-methylase UbiE
MFDPVRYDAWFETESGRFALEAEKRLLSAVVAGWPRRGQKLLEIGCGTGVFLEALWEMGFEVSGLDPAPTMLAAARERLKNRADLHLAHGEHLPFADKEFDFAVLWTALEFCADPEIVLREAARVAAKGLLVGFLNRHSLYFLLKGRPGSGGTLATARWFSPQRMRRLIKSATGTTPNSGRSVLLGPPSTWIDAHPWKELNHPCWPGCLGVFCALRADFVNQKPLTPIMAWKTEPQRG